MIKGKAVETEVVPEETPLVNDHKGQITVKRGIGAWVTTLSVDTYEKLKAEAAAIDPESTGIAVTARYKEFAVDESVVGIFTGEDGITPKDEITQHAIYCKSVQWMGIDGRLYQCAGVALVNQFFGENGEYLIPLGTRVKITHTGKSNRTKLYEVEILS